MMSKMVRVPRYLVPFVVLLAVVAVLTWTAPGVHAKPREDAGLSSVDTAIQPDTTVQTITVNRGSLTDHACDDDEWHFVITQISPDTAAPAYIDVWWYGGIHETLPLAKVTGGTAHYHWLYGHFDLPVVNATAEIYSGWSGTFNLSHGPCCFHAVTVTPTSGELNCKVSSVLLTAHVTGGVGPFTYQWYRNGTAIVGATGTTYTATSAGSYYVIVKDNYSGYTASHCDATSNVSAVTSVPDPQVSVTPTGGTLTCTVRQLLLTATVTGGEGPFAYQWYKNGVAITGATGSTYTVKSAGTYKVVVTDNNGCSDDSDPVEIGYDYGVQVSGHKYDADTMEPISGWNIYIRKTVGGANLYSTTTDENGYYFFTGITQCNQALWVVEEQRSGWQYVSYYYKEINLTCPPSGTVVGQEVEPDRLDPNCPPAKCEWTVDFKNRRVCPTVSVTPTSGELNCNVESVLLTASVTGGVGPFTYQWYKDGSKITGATSSTYLATSAGTYYVRVGDGPYCDVRSNDSVVTSVPDPQVSVTPTGGELNCKVSSVLLTASVTGGEGPFGYQWYKDGSAIAGATSSTYSATSAGVYKVVVTDANGCTDDSDEVTVTSVPDPQVSVTPTSGELNCKVESVLLTASVTGGEGPFAYQWYKDGSAIAGATSSTYSATSAGTYKVVVTDANGCSDDSNEVTVTSVPDPQVSVTPVKK